MSCRIETHHQLNGLRRLRLENDLLAVDILPEAGGKVYSFIHKPSSMNLLWQNPRLLPERVPYGARFDDNWAGGWDEMLPNDTPYTYANGDVLPDHGEFWSQPCDWQITTHSDAEITLSLSSYGRVYPTRFTKQLTLRADEPILRVNYSYENLGYRAIDYLWSIHPALAIAPATRLAVPALRAVVAPWMNEQFPAHQQYDWPFATDCDGRVVDLRQVPPATEARADMHHLLDVAAGWYAVTDTQRRVGFALVFPTTHFPHLWLFRAIGGWRGFNTLMLEASNARSSDFAEALARGECARLEPGQRVEASVLAIAYAGLSDVAHVAPDGTVVGLTL